jgi:hypothetical protein
MSLPYITRFDNKITHQIIQPTSLEEIVSKSTLLATRPSRLAPKKCINKSIWLATGGAPSMGTPRVPSGCQPNWFVYAFSWVQSPQRRVDLDTISSSACSHTWRCHHCHYCNVDYVYSVMSHATLILYCHASMLTLQTSLISRALWLP